jgi:hypothetical protein
MELNGEFDPTAPDHPERLPAMTNRSEAIALAAGGAIMALVLWALFHTAAQCHAAGGTTVRGLIWLECIR